MKLADIKDEVKRVTGKDIKTRAVVADLGQMTTMQEYENLAN